jgi:hypothetical protein
MSFMIDPDGQHGGIWETATNVWDSLRGVAMKWHTAHDVQAKSAVTCFRLYFSN